MFKEIKLAAELSNKAQRNWDHGITIPKKDINTIIPDGKYFHKPPNKVHKDKSKYNRKQKHKNDKD